MLLIWGRKWYTTKLGFVADFCEICRRPQPFTLERRSLTGHIWYLPMGSTYAVTHQGRCTRCGTERQTDKARYAQVARKNTGSARDLLATTLPDHEQVLKQRMDVERVVREDIASLPPDWRRELIARPFVTLSPMVEQRFASTHLDARSAAALLSLFVFPPLMTVLSAMIMPDDAEVGAIAGLALTIGLLIWGGMGAKRRWILKAVAPRLADSLAPLRPTDAELEGVLTELRTHKHRMGQYVKVADLKRQATSPSDRVSGGAA